MNIDTALRYDPIVDQINKSKYKKYPVLEIGSGINGISDYYQGQVYGVDDDFSKTHTHKNSNINLVKGSILKIPFEDDSFYIVVCVDTLEHLSSNNRLQAVKELLRVTKKGGQLFLGFPTGSFSAKLEEMINSLFKKVQGRNHPWLVEHIEFGLPESDKVVKEIQSKGVKQVMVTPNLNVFMWFMIHFLFTVNDGKKIAKLFKLIEGLVYELAKIISIPPFYRVILIVTR